MKTAIPLFFIFTLFLNGCSNRQKPEKQPGTTVADSIEIIQQPYENSPGVTEYEIPVLRGTKIRHGIQKRYYQHGSLYSEIPYVRGKRNGTAFTYYQAVPGVKPVVWKEQPYVNDTLHGICKRYHRSGKIQAEYEYKKGLAAVGITEFTESGKPVKTPELILSKAKTGQYYFISAKLSDNTKNVNYYLGDLVEGKYFPENLKGLQVRNGVGEVLVPADSKSVTITAVYFSDYRNQVILSKTILM